MEIVRSFKCIGTVIKNTTNETEEIKTRTLPSNKTPYPLPRIFRPKKSTKIVK